MARYYIPRRPNPRAEADLMQCGAGPPISPLHRPASIWPERVKAVPEPWSNWSGSIRFAPQAIERPSTDGELSAIIRRTASEHGTIRPVGTGHTSSGLLATDGTLVS
ncbi:MAG: hypothetical protein EHJ95_02810, partial [Methanobacteriota archaeon]